MKILKKVKVTEIQEKIEDVKCNRCGRSCKYELSKDSYNLNALYVEGVFGYGSKIDGTSISFELCDRCIVEIMSDFAIPPVLKSILGGNGSLTVEDLRQMLDEEGWPSGRW